MAEHEEDTPTPPDRPAARTAESPRAQDAIGSVAPPQMRGFLPRERLGLRATIDVLLKDPVRVTDAIVAGQERRLSAILLLVVAVCVGTYGVVMGVFSGGPQLWVVPIRVVVGVLLSGLICTPSLYVLASLSGARQSLGETVGLLAQALAVMSVVMAGFAPITWVFSQATSSAGFMGTMHLVFWGVSVFLALRLFRRAFSRLNERPVKALRLWSLVFVVVVLQMSTSLRPLVGEFDGYGLQGKQFFLAHWVESLRAE